jgi:hypothetical protein
MDRVPFVLACFQASAAPRPENSDPDEKDALFGLDTQITIVRFRFRANQNTKSISRDLSPAARSDCLCLNHFHFRPKLKFLCESNFVRFGPRSGAN